MPSLDFDGLVQERSALLKQYRKSDPNNRDDIKTKLANNEDALQGSLKGSSSKFIKNEKNNYLRQWFSGEPFALPTLPETTTLNPSPEDHSLGTFVLLKEERLELLKKLKHPNYYNESKEILKALDKNKAFLNNNIGEEPADKTGKAYQQWQGRHNALGTPSLFQEIKPPQYPPTTYLDALFLRLSDKDSSMRATIKKEITKEQGLAAGIVEQTPQKTRKFSLSFSFSLPKKGFFSNLNSLGSSLKSLSSKKDRDSPR